MVRDKPLKSQSRLKETNNIKYVSSGLLSPFESITHGFLSRVGGVSGPPFSSLNFDGRTDSVGNVAKNMELLSRASGTPMEKLVLVNQVHGNSVLILDDFPGGAASYKLVDADAIITGLTGFPIGVLTADCLPVLLYDPVNNIIGAVHAGWKGTLRGVSVKAVESMRSRFGSRPRDILAAFGPYIGPCCYSVKENVFLEFKDAFGEELNYFYREGGELMLDIGDANIEQLHSAGLSEENISISSWCTSCNNDLFFSYRKEGGMTGRQLSFVMLRSVR